MTEPSQQDMQRVRHLAWSLATGEIADDDHAELELLLRSHTLLLREYLRAVKLVADCQVFDNPRLLNNPAVNVTASSAVESKPTERTLAQPRAVGARWRGMNWVERFSQSAVANTFAIALLVYGLFAALVWQMALVEMPTGEGHAGAGFSASGDGSNSAALAGASPSADRPILATVISGEQCVWQDDAVAFTKGALLADTQLRLKSGTLQLEFANAARVVLSGPCVFDVAQVDRGYLRHGKLFAEVPRRGIGFQIGTPTAEIVDLGTEFGVQVADAGDTEVHVLRGLVVSRPANGVQLGAAPASEVELRAGQSLFYASAGGGELNEGQPTPFAKEKFAELREQLAAAPARRPSVPTHSESIPLGCLFDARPPISIVDAVKMDTFGAVPDIGHLGIERVYSGVAQKLILAPGVQFDFGQLGWAGQYYSGVTNAAPFPLTRESRVFALRTTGGADVPADMVESGIGMHADNYITFNLEAIRQAAGWQGRELKFVCGRAGLNDTSIGKICSVHLAAIVAREGQVLKAYVNGRGTAFSQADGIWRLNDDAGPPLVADAKYVRFDVALPATASYLTLVAACADGSNGSDHAVWSQPKLELAVEAAK